MFFDTQESEVRDGDHWAPVIQNYVNQGIRLKDMPAKIQRDHNFSISQRSISRIITKYKLRTPRLPHISLEEMKSAIITITLEKDPLQEWGIRLILEELRMESIHVPRRIIELVQRQRDPDEARRRWSGNKKIVCKTLFSSGPNEEWCMDGHEKLRDSMGIDVWGICDKYSRYELGLWAIPNARRSQVPIALFLRVVKEQEGVPLQLTGDKGSENGKVSVFQTALRTHFAPALSVELFPPVRLVRSVRNITRERSWRPLWEKELKNVLAAWRSGQQTVGYIHGNETHRELATWLWAKLVQARLDRVRERQAHHRIRKQCRVILPTGGTPHNFYHHPEEYRSMDMLIKIPNANMPLIDKLIDQYSSDNLLQFGDDASVALFEGLYEYVSSPELTLVNTWTVWRSMINLLETSRANYVYV